MAGDQPAVIMDLVDEVRLLGFRPILAGNIKSLLDHKRTPETQRGVRRGARPAPEDDHVVRRRHQDRGRDGRRRQRDRVRRRRRAACSARGPSASSRPRSGSISRRCSSARSSTTSSGAEPSFGVFVLGYEEDPLTRAYMKFYKMGDGPGLHVLPPVPPRAARDGAVRRPRRPAPRRRPPRRSAGPVTEVVAQAKRDLAVGRDARRDRRVHRLRHARERRTPLDASASCRWA